MVRTSPLADDDLAGNAPDSRNPGKRQHDRLVSHGEQNNRDGNDDSAGSPRGRNGDLAGIRLPDTVAARANGGALGGATPEARRAALAVREATGSGPGFPDRSAPPASPTSLFSESGSRRGFAARLRAGSRRLGPSGGLIGLLVGGFGIFSVVAAPASLLVAIEKAITNDSSDSTRTNIMFRRAYVGKLFSKTKSGSSPIEEKLTKMSPDQQARWEKEGFKFEMGPDGKIAKATFPDGTAVNDGKAFTDHAEKTPEGRRASSRVLDIRSAFFNNQRFRDILRPFGIEKSNRLSPSEDPDPKKRKQAIDRSFDDNTKLKAEPDKNARVSALKEKTTGEGGSKLKGAVDSINDKVGKAAWVSAPVAAACAAYNVARLTNATIKAQWIYQLVNFAYPFVRAAAQIESQGDIEPSVVENLANRLTWYNPDPNAPDYNRTAMDSQGLKMAIYGDFSALSDFSKTYTSWYWETAIASTADDIMSTWNTVLGGKENAKQTCKIVHTVNGVASVGCLLGGWVSKATCIAGAWLFSQAEKPAEAWLVAQLAQPALDFLATVDLSSALQGEAAGDALAAGLGLLLSNSTLGSGLTVAGGPDALDKIKNFISYTDDVNYTYTTQLALDDAKTNPLDVSNQYSFMGQLSSLLHPYLSNDGAAFSTLANLTTVVNRSLAALPGISAHALFSQPSNMTAPNPLGGDPTLNRISKCQDPDLAGIGAACDWSGRIIGYTSDTVLSGLTNITNGTAGSYDILTQSINYLTSNKDIDSQTGSTTSGSEFDNWVNGCVIRQMPDGNGTLPIGSTTASITDDNYDWTTGEKCIAKTPDEQKQLDAFSTYYNFCYLQYATAERKTDCVHDTAADGSAPNGSIAEVATAMGAWGGQYQACYTWAGGHGSTEDLKRRIDHHFAGPENGVDCSGFTRAVIYQATGKDPGAMSTSSMCADSAMFEKVPRAQAQPGDFAINCTTHVEVITGVNGGNFSTVGAHTDGCGPGKGPSPGKYQGTESFVLRYKGTK